MRLEIFCKDVLKEFDHSQSTLSKNVGMPVGLSVIFFSCCGFSWSVNRRKLKQPSEVPFSSQKLFRSTKVISCSLNRVFENLKPR